MKVGSAIIVGTGFTFTLCSLSLAAEPQLPTPCVAGSCGSNLPWVSSGQASAVFSGSRLDVTQTTAKATLNWQNFNVGADNTVRFIQPGTDSIALNRIFQADPSRIQGSIQANGQIYLINRNGIIFDKGAQVNAHSFVASSLDIADDVLEKGVFAPLRDGRPAFALTPKVDENGKPVPGGDVLVEAGATIRTGQAGRIMLLAPNVENKGTLQAPDGQVILAAGEKAWIADSDDPNLRGFLVEVDAGGTARNAGDLLADRGNISLVGLAVNQDGRASAKTAVNLAGSVRLVARDTVRVQPTAGGMVTERTGSLQFGEDSVTEILPDFADTTTAVDEQAQPKARISAMGKTVEVGKNARLVATSGTIDLVATTNPANPLVGQTAGNGSRIEIGTGAVLDVSGTQGVLLPMERNVLTVELRGNELRDSPEQRDGVLYGKKIKVDIRKGTPVADISGALATIQRGVGERTSAGGTISLRSEDAVSVGAGSKLDVSGGSVRYASGVIDTTKVLSEGRLIDISEADPDRRYDAILTTIESTSYRWGITRKWDLPGASSLAAEEAGYVEGKDAGTISLLGTQMQLAGTLLGSTVKGRYQRDLPAAVDLSWSRPTSQLALGGQLILGDPAQLSATSGTANFRLPSVMFQSPTQSGAEPRLEAGIDSDTLLLDPGSFARGGLTRVAIYSNGRIELPEEESLTLAPGGELTLVSGSVVTTDPDTTPEASPVEPGTAVPASLRIDGDITIPSGKITLRTVQNAILGGTAEVDSHNALAVGSGSRLDVSGQWVNDTVGVAPTLPEDIIATRGGSISLLSAGAVDVADGASFLLNAGAWLNRSDKLTAGRGGDLSIASALAAPATLHFGGTAESFGLLEGGTLSLSAGGVWIMDTARNSVSDSVLAVNPAFFQEGGFSRYNLTATHLGLTVDEETVVRPRALNWVLDPSSSSAPTGTAFASFAHLEVLPDYDRRPVSVSLTSRRGGERSILDAGITVARGAAIIADPGASISLTSDRRIDVMGELRTPAGEISLILTDKTLSDPEFFPDKAIRLRSGSILSAMGYVQSIPNELGLTQSEVLDAGTVSLRGERGTIITDPGSLIDVSGTSGFRDILQPGADANNPYVRNEIAGAAGSILLQAPDGMLLTGSMRANRAAAPGASGGSLTISLSTFPIPDTQNGTLRDPTGVREVVFRTDSPDTLFPENLHGNSLFSESALARLRSDSNNVESRATVSLAQLHAADLDELNVTVRPVTRESKPLNDARIVFDSGTHLQAGRSIVLDAPILWGGGGNALLDAPYIALGPTDTIIRYSPAAILGAGTLQARADLIDLVGDLAVQGFGDAGHAALSLESSGDIRLNGLRVPEQSSVDSIGSLKVEGTLRLSAAQIYPTTLTQFTLQAVGPRSLVSVSGTGTSSAPVPLSAGGLLRIQSDRIDVAGTLRAPHGQIVLDAADSLSVKTGGEVSVAGSSIPVPFGATQFGRDWVLPYEPTLTRVLEGAEDAVWSTGLPEKRVDLKGDNVNLESGSKIVLDGGGDLLASEFIPGPGGSRDILLPENARGAIAIVPALKSGTAPIDPFTHYEGLKVGDTIEIGTGTPDLPAGTYAVLPARYALLPGAILLTPTGTTGLTRSDAASTLRGLPVVAARRGAGMAGTFESLWSGYVVENGTQVRERAEYRESLASKFFADKAASLQMPADAGRLTINAGAGLALAGAVSAEGPGRGGQVDIAADNLSVVSSLSDRTDRVELLDSQLSSLRVESLLLGGQRERTSEGVRIDASARRVSIESGVDLELPELILAARPGAPIGNGGSTQTPPEAATDGVYVAGGATLRGVGAAASSPSALLVDGDTALLRVSSGQAVDVERTGAPSASGSAQIVLESGSALFAGTMEGQSLKGGSITIDSGGNAASSADLTLGSQGALQLAAARISLGGDSETSSGEGLVLSRDVLSRLNVSNLSLKSRSSIDFLGDLDFGVSGTLTLDAPVLQGSADSGNLVASVHADTLRWKSSAGPAAVSGTDLTGELRLTASTLLLGESPRADDANASSTSSRLAVGGFATTRLEGSSQLVMSGSGTLETSGELQMAAPWVTTADGANWVVNAREALTLSSTAANSAPMPTNVGLGSTLSLTGASVTLAGGLLLPAGSVSLKATGEGPDTGNVRLASNALISAGAVRELFLDKAVETPGGRVALTAEHGDVLIEAGAKIDVSGRDGTFAVQAQGLAKLEGSFIANAGGLQDGNFVLSAGHIDDFSALNSLLNAGGFGASRHIRLGSGDASIGAGQTIRARDVSITLDDGSFHLGGVIDASGDSAGRVQIFGRGDVTLDSGSRIDASARGSDRLGGSVLLGSSTGIVSVSQGATIDVRGTRQVIQERVVLDADDQPIQRTGPDGAPLFDSLGQPLYLLEEVALTDTGRVSYRMSRSILDTGSSRVPQLGGTVLGAASIGIEGFRTYVDSTIDGSDVMPDVSNPLFGDAADFMSRESSILDSLGVFADERYHLLAGIEITSPGDMTLTSAWNLADWRFGAKAEPGVLTLRAGGNLLLDQSLSDGVDPIIDPIFGTEKDVLRNDRSWTYNLVAGADFSSANNLATTSGIGDLAIGGGAAVRTGSGDITVRAGRDVVLSDQTSVLYTAGRNAGSGTLDQVLQGLYIDGVYPQLGGSVDIDAGRDVTAARSDQLVNDWFWRMGGSDPLLGDLPTSWNVSLSNFRQGVAAFGGGNVKVAAGGNIKDLSVSVPTTGRQVGDHVLDLNTSTITVNSDRVVVDGGDSLSVRAGGDILGGLFFIHRGTGELTAGGSITREGDSGLYAMLALGDGDWRVTAGRDAAIETVFDPTEVPQALLQGAFPTPSTTSSSYTDKSSLHLTAIAGQARLNQNLDAIRSHPFLSSMGADPALINRYVFYPGNLQAASLRNDLVVGNVLTMVAAPTGALNLFADRSVLAASGGASIVMLDVPEAPPVHVGDFDPVRVVARRGDIGREIFGLDLPKAARLDAGGDILNVRLDGQNLHAQDVTSLTAGGSITHETIRADSGALSGTALTYYRVAGPGRVDLLAGGDIDLGTAGGILTTGNLENPLLPSGGASVSVVAGLREAPRFDAFIDKYLVGSTEYASALTKYLSAYQTNPALGSVENFRALPMEQQRPFLWQTFFDELRTSGVDATKSGSQDYSRGYAAIDVLFPESVYAEARPNDDLSLLLSRISTLDGGDINVIVPGGAANAGVATTSQLIKQPSELGVVVQRAGNVNAFTRGDFLVNQSRVFTLDGGSILMWSGKGNIDAGRGAKSALAAPPPIVTTDPNGNTVIQFPPAIAGSGIRSIVTTPGVKPGDVYLFAPSGVVSAGDAGIGSAGNVIIGAVQVIGADNIDVGGVAIGIPVDTGGLATSLASVSAVASGASEASLSSSSPSAPEQSAPLAESALGWLDVFVEGFGEEACKPNDAACLERQRTP